VKAIQTLAFAVAFALPVAVYAADQTPMQPGSMNQGNMNQGNMNPGAMNQGGMNMGQGGSVGASNMHGAGNMPGMAAGMSQGQIRRVDKSGKKLTIKHGPLANLDMPAMTMVFKVKDPAMMDRVKVGDKVNFVAEQIDGVLTVTSIEAAQ
jgi:Cu/Ag efflux protein CusF